ncbi:hypothetical protein [Rhizosaccharibacter radicis]|uniref:Tryptophan synthase subunit beta n=1 Tax=Rhizosaccharibacter radicis TaxID=2782605 RepID=A0ABT1VY19_9PROT|nr:hypothetical protein [Acetobacteraceae bacterium KSS12]
MPDAGSTAAPDREEAERRRRLSLLIGRLPDRLQRVVNRLLEPRARWIRIPAGLLFMLGGVLAILPVFGLWMLPLGIVLLAEDVPPLRRLTGRCLAWIERRHPGWMGLPTRPEAQ